MDWLKVWWERVFRGNTTPDAATTRSGMKPLAAQSASTGTSRSAKPGLALTETPKKAAPKRVAAAGFDPYGNDGGYSKPHGWDRVDHR